MTSRIASAYDRNPARLALVVKSNRKKGSSGGAVLGFIFCLVAVSVGLWNFLPA